MLLRHRYIERNGDYGETISMAQRTRPWIGYQWQQRALTRKIGKNAERVQREKSLHDFGLLWSIERIMNGGARGEIYF